MHLQSSAYFPAQRVLNARWPLQFLSSLPLPPSPGPVLTTLASFHSCAPSPSDYFVSTSLMPALCRGHSP